MSNAGIFGGITPAGFIAKWSRVALPERAASQEHFIDLCRLLGQPTPAEHDATGAEYTFEKGVAVTEGASRGAKGDSGYADAWWRGKFAWEYKRKDKYKDLTDAYRQVCKYREALDNPPLLIVSDITRTEIHTNFTGTAKQVHVVLLKDMGTPEALSLLRRVFTNPESFRPTITAEKVTQEVATSIGSLASCLQARGHDPHATAHFLMKCMFCLFAEDVNLLPDKLFSRLLTAWHDQPAELTARMSELFDKMRTGGAFGTERIAWFNGGLFDPSPALPLKYDEIGLLRIAAEQDWGSVEPAIFGTLFERSLDPTKRAQIGAHYTSRDDIMLIVEPVVMAPLRHQWKQVQADVEKQIERRRAGAKPAKKKADEAISDLLQGFLNRLAAAQILDPACGSGNFLYVAIQQLLNLEKEVITFAARGDIGLGLFPSVRPSQLHGIEINPYAAELAQVVIWIGYLQWMRDNGFNAPRDPILETLSTIQNRDAIINWIDEKGKFLPVWKEGAFSAGPAHWPIADFIIGNPPFLGSKLFRASGLHDEYVKAMYLQYLIPKSSDLCCYWFERARTEVGNGRRSRDSKFSTPPDNHTYLRYLSLTKSEEIARSLTVKHSPFRS
ncbi:MAG: class I SAM-dependent DNA methyltransferase, partial [Planctomycetaceae bacterium]